MFQSSPIYMNYQVLYDNPSESLITRLLKVRHIDDHIDSFLDPKISEYRLDPFLLNDMEKAVDRIIKAMKNKEKIMIFWDYDVDGVTSSYVLYRFLTKYLNYKNVSIQYPDRLKEWYGLKKLHIDQMKEKNIDLIITVDNGIASLEEWVYAKEKNIDLIITDHHQDLESIPEAVAVVNPQVSPNYPFKWLAGVGVAFKLVCALLTKSTFDQEKRNQIFNYFLPIVTIGTVADIVPLVGENRAIVKRWLELMNSRHKDLPSSIKGFLDYLGIKDAIDTYHIGFLIGPRINAGGRIKSPYESLYALLCSGEQQLQHLENLEKINTERKAMQEEMIKKAETIVDLSKKFLFIADEEFHEWVVGIVSGRITDKYNKPSLIMKIDREKNLCTASLRWPDYFNVIDMIKSAADILVRFGGHKGAWWLGVKLEHMDELKQRFECYCEHCIKDEDIAKSLLIDTKIYDHEWNRETLSALDRLAPFGEGNDEPMFLLENVQVNKIEKVWNKERTHLKIHAQFGNNKFSAMFWGKGDEAEGRGTNPPLTPPLSRRGTWPHEGRVNLIGKVKKDNFNGGYFLDGNSREF